jgi:hypothetical protein
VKAVIQAARKAGVKEVTVKVGAGSVVIPLAPNNAPVVEDANEWLGGDDADKA